MAVAYVTLPILIYLWGWLRPIVAVPSCFLIIWILYKTNKNVTLSTDISINKNTKFWLISLGIIALWVLFSGIGSFSYQTGDYASRNPMFRDLYMCAEWPVKYDLSMEPDLVKKFIGSNTSALYVYYFAWWLPAAMGARIISMLGFGTAVVKLSANSFIYLWAVLGLFLTFYCLVQLINKYSWWVLAAMILFGGMDWLIYVFKNLSLPCKAHLEWIMTPHMFQYSANTTQLYWVFNQSIPVWLIVVLMLLLRNNSCIAGVASLSFAYSPFSTMGLVPIAIVATLDSKTGTIKEKIKSACTLSNIGVSVMMLIVFGSFYMLVQEKATSGGGLIFIVWKEMRTVTVYITFIISEVLVYFFAMGEAARKYRLYKVVLIELLLFPLWYLGTYDFTMRASIPALFIMMIFCLRYLFDEDERITKMRRTVLAIIMCIGFMTSVTEIQRNVTITLDQTSAEYGSFAKSINSFGNITTDRESLIRLILRQYMAFNEEYEDSFFVKYLMQK